jgi:sugar phosphate isomerase/epimerase
LGSWAVALKLLPVAALLIACGSAAVAWGQTAPPADPFGWRLGVAAWSFNRFTFYETADRTAALGLRYIEAFEGQRVRMDSDLKLTADLPDEELARIRAKLTAAKLRLTSLYIHELPVEDLACRKAFEFGRKLGVETIISEPKPEALNLIERLCDEYRISVALHNHAKGASRYWDPQEVVRVCEGRSPRLGACADIGHWQRSGIKPLDGVRILGRRLLSLHVKDLNESGPNGHDVWWGTGQGDIAGLLREVRRLGVTPTLFAIEYEDNWDDNRNDIAQCAKFFRETVAQIAARPSQERPLFAGWATANITPLRPVNLVGQYEKRIARAARDPLTVTALALETRDGTEPVEQAILVSCDVIGIPKVITERLRERLAPLLPGFELRKLVLNATHTHTAPGLVDTAYPPYDLSGDPGVMKPSEYAEFFLERVAQAVVEAWQNRKPAGLSWGLGFASVGTNRRATYFDGKTVMYGDTAAANFSHVEGYRDDGVELLFCWNEAKKLTGVVVNVACTSQETEHLTEVSADFWHETREEIRRRTGPEVFVLAQCAAAGDQSPHLLFRKQAEDLMAQRRGLTRRQEIARRIASAVEDVLPVAQQHMRTSLIFRHEVVQVDLPEKVPPSPAFIEADSVHPIEAHVLRLGDVAMATNPFELFLDYGIRLKARSKAVLTLVVQIAGQDCGYLPTERAVRGGGYSAENFLVGPAGGQVLVDETVKRVNELFP